MSSSSISHPNLFQVFHPICGVRASPLSYPTTVLDSKSSKPGWLKIELRNFMAEERGADGTRAAEAVSRFYVWQVTVEKDPRVSRRLTMNVIGAGPLVAPTQEVWGPGLSGYCGAANPFMREVCPRTMVKGPAGPS